MKKIVAAYLLLLLTTCSLQEDPYKDYPELRKTASARCDKLGYIPGSPDFYACVGVQYTRLKQGQ